MIEEVRNTPRIAIGKAVHIDDMQIKVDKEIQNSIAEELKKLGIAIDEAKNQIKDIYSYTLECAGIKQAQIFLKHREILEDTKLLGRIISHIKDEEVSAEWAVHDAKEYYIQLASQDAEEQVEYGAIDIEAVLTRLIKILKADTILDSSILYDGLILISEDIPESLGEYLDKYNVLGFVSKSDANDEALELLEENEVPSVFNISSTDDINTKDVLIIDGEEKKLLARPTNNEIKKYVSMLEGVDETGFKYTQLIDNDITTSDGFPISLAIAGDTVSDIGNIYDEKYNGIGLINTDHIFSSINDYPDEETQIAIYTSIIEGLPDCPITFRTADSMQGTNMGLLSLKSTRMCLSKSTLIRTQLRALLRVSAFVKIKLLIPMISSYEELVEFKCILAVVKEELTKEGKAFDNDIEVGIVLEVPSAAFILEILAKEVDFITIDSSDLLQYTVAVDSKDLEVANLYNTYHPALLRLIKLIIDKGHSLGKQVGIYGISADDRRLTPILIGLGIDEIIIDPDSYEDADEVITATHKGSIEKIITKVLNMPSAKAVEAFIKIHFR